MDTCMRYLQCNLAYLVAIANNHTNILGNLRPTLPSSLRLPRECNTSPSSQASVAPTVAISRRGESASICSIVQGILLGGIPV